MTDRREEIRAALAAVRDRIGAAAARSGRSADAVRLIAITKTVPAADVALAAELGVTDVGENRVQEALGKQPGLPRRWPGTWSAGSRPTRPGRPSGRSAWSTPWTGRSSPWP